MVFVSPLIKGPYENLNLEWPSYVFQPGPRIRKPSSLTPNFDPIFASSSLKIFRKKQKRGRNTRCVRPFRKDKAIMFLSKLLFGRNYFTDRVYTLLRCVSAPLGPSYKPLPVRLPKRYSVFNSQPRFRSRLQAAFYCLVHRTSWFSRRIPPGWGTVGFHAGLILPRYGICFDLDLEL